MDVESELLFPPTLRDTPAAVASSHPPTASAASAARHAQPLSQDLVWLSSGIKAPTLHIDTSNPATPGSHQNAIPYYLEQAEKILGGADEVVVISSGEGWLIGKFAKSKGCKVKRWRPSELTN
jgi:hypothetical protein